MRHKIVEWHTGRQEVKQAGWVVSIWDSFYAKTNISMILNFTLAHDMKWVHFIDMWVSER